MRKKYVSWARKEAAEGWVWAVRRTLIAYEFDEPFAALISSSARHSAMDLTLRNADSRVCNTT